MNEARAILSQEAPAVFGRNGSMCEPATHAPWAGMIIRRAQAHGVSAPAEQAEVLVACSKKRSDELASTATPIRHPGRPKRRVYTRREGCCAPEGCGAHMRGFVPCLRCA